MAFADRRLIASSSFVQTNNNTNTKIIGIALPEDSVTSLSVEVVGCNLTSSYNVYSWQGSMIATMSGSMATLQTPGNYSELQPSSSLESIAGASFGTSGNELTLNVSGSSTTSWLWGCVVSGIQLVTGSR